MSGYLNMTEAAKYAGISRRQIYRWLEDGLPRHPRGGCKLIKISDLEAFIEEKPGRPNTRKRYL